MYSTSSTRTKGRCLCTLFSRVKIFRNAQALAKCYASQGPKQNSCAIFRMPSCSRVEREHSLMNYRKATYLTPELRQYEVFASIVVHHRQRVEFTEDSISPSWPKRPRDKRRTNLRSHRIQPHTVDGGPFPQQTEYLNQDADACLLASNNRHLMKGIA